MVKQKIFSTSHSLPSETKPHAKKHREDIFRHTAPESAFHTALLRKLLGLPSKGLEEREKKYEYINKRGRDGIQETVHPA